MTIFSASVLLFLVIDPIGNIPFFLTALKNVAPSRQKIIILREILIALVVLIIFLFAGPYLLRTLGISEPSLTLSGGIILFLIAIKMVFPSTQITLEQSTDGEPFIVPLAIPYVAGPSAMAAVLFIMNQNPERWLEWLLALLIAWLISGLIIFLSSNLSRFLGQKGLIAIERLMGMILVTIAVQMFMNGIIQFLEL